MQSTTFPLRRSGTPGNQDEKTLHTQRLYQVGNSRLMACTSHIRLVSTIGHSISSNPIRQKAFTYIYCTWTYIMRPQIPDSLEKRVEETVERGGYSTGSELVRDAVRRHVEELEGFPSDRTIRNWLENERRIELISEEFPQWEYDLETEEMETIEDVDLTILVRASNVPVWVHAGERRDNIVLHATVLRTSEYQFDESLLLNGPGVVVGLDSEKRHTQDLSGGAGIGLRKSMDRSDLNKSQFTENILGIGGTVRTAIDGNPRFKELFQYNIA